MEYLYADGGQNLNWAYINTCSLPARIERSKRFQPCHIKLLNRDDV